MVDRNWQWRSDEYKYAASRAKSMPGTYLIVISNLRQVFFFYKGYVGSYAMDALAMALHCAWTTKSLPEAMLKVSILIDSCSIF